MQFTTPFLVALGLITATNGYVIQVFRGESCTGDNFENNVWDNTCSTPNYGARSFKLIWYGGGNQKVRMHSSSGCGGEVVYGPRNAGYEDGGDWKQGVCTTISGGKVANAFGSFAV